jgi:hypothetical protein
VFPGRYYIRAFSGLFTNTCVSESEVFLAKIPFDNVVPVDAVLQKHREFRVLVSGCLRYGKCMKHHYYCYLFGLC